MFEILTVGMLRKANLRHRAKSRRNQSNRGRDMAIFRFCKIAAAAILDSQNLKLLTVERLQRAELRRIAKFGRNRTNPCRDMVIFRFFKMAAVRHLGFVMCVFGPPTKGIWWSLSLCKNLV